MANVGTTLGAVIFRESALEPLERNAPLESVMVPVFTTILVPLPKVIGPESVRSEPP